LTKGKSTNRVFIELCAILCLLFLASCASTGRVEYREESDYGIASWYGSELNGKRTASGERFDMYGMTCAHRSFAFGTRLRVTNPENNKSVIVTVNDRGPFVRGRDLDLSYGAAKKIGIIRQGVGRVKIERLP
jgi:rare lipoprotein A